MKRELLISVDLKVVEYCPIKLKQYDSTKLTFNVLSDSLEINLNDLSAELIFTKPDNTVVIQNCEIEENKVVADLLPDCLRLSGNSKIEVALKKENETFSSFFIPVKIEASGKENIKSSNTPNYIEDLEEAILEEQERQENESNRIAAEEEREDNEEQRNSSENERVKAEKERENSETERVKAENERINAEEERENSETERVEAETIRNNNETNRINIFNNMTAQIQPTYRYYFFVESEITGDSPFEISANYIKDANVLEVYYNGERLIKAESDDSQGHYYELGDAGAVSNQIRLTSDWEALPGDVFEFVIKGVYTNETTT